MIKLKEIKKIEIKIFEIICSSCGKKQTFSDQESYEAIMTEWSLIKINGKNFYFCFECGINKKLDRNYTQNLFLR